MFISDIIFSGKTIEQIITSLSVTRCKMSVSESSLLKNSSLALTYLTNLHIKLYKKSSIIVKLIPNHNISRYLHFIGFTMIELLCVALYIDRYLHFQIGVKKEFFLDKELSDSDILHLVHT